MLCGISLQDAVLLVGTNKGTNRHQLTAAIEAYGVRCSTPPDMDLSATSLIRYESTDGSRSHWLVRHKNKFYDPAMGVRRALPRYLSGSEQKFFIEIHRD